MSLPDWQRVRTLFERAVELTEAQRQEFLAAECGDDSSVRRAVLEMLAHDAAHAPGFLEPPPPTPAPDPGMRLGEFVLLKELGRGSMGVVYLADQPSLKRSVAVKVLVEGVATTSTQVERFHREARAAGKLSHRGIVQVFAEGREGGTHWFAMELVDGRDLASELRNRSRPMQPPGRIPGQLPAIDSGELIATAARIVAEIAEALAHAHEHGIVHRDVKPSNVLITRSGDARLVDFGIARDQSFGTLTQDGQLMGSLPYMSPEQAQLLDTPVDHRTDIYSAGVVLYELLTSRLPFGGSGSIELLSRIRRNEPIAARRLNHRVPRELALVCEKAMRGLPERRYETANEFAADLRRFLRHEAVLATPPSLGERFRRRIRIHRYAILTTTLLALAAVLAVTWDRNARAAALTTQTEARLQGFVNLFDARARRTPLSEYGALSPETLENARRTIAAARTDVDTSEFGRRSCDLLENRIQAFADHLEATSNALWKDLAIVERDDQNEFVRLVVALIENVHHMSAMFPGRTPIPEAALQPRVSITLRDANGAPLRGIASQTLLDRRSGEPGRTIPLGPLPLRDSPIGAGYGRLKVRQPDGSILEFTRQFRIGQNLHIDHALAFDAPSANRMVHISGGTFVEDPRFRTPKGRRGWAIHDFLLDEAEVSNADYRRYLAAHPDAERPTYWPQVAPGSALDAHPVSDLSWEQMRAYAEWVGKRLPTVGEWIWAARNGNERRDYPWPDPSAIARMPNTTLRDLKGYLEFTLPVRSEPDLAATTPATLYHLLGNVAEVTETPIVEVIDNKPQQLIWSRFVAGSYWTARARDRRLDWFEKGGRGPAMKSHTIGFRCARSLAPN